MFVPKGQINNIPAVMVKYRVTFVSRNPASPIFIISMFHALRDIKQPCDYVESLQYHEIYL